MKKASKNLILSYLILSYLILSYGEVKAEWNGFGEFEAFEIQDMSVVGTMAVGDTVTLSVTLNSNVSGESHFILRGNNSMTPIGISGNNNYYIDTAEVDTNDIIVKTYQLRIDNLYECSLAFGANLTNPGILCNYAAKEIQFRPDGSDLTLVNPCNLENEINIDYRCEQYFKVNPVCQLIGEPQNFRHIEITGKVVYTEWAEEYLPRPKGALNDVWLYFHKSNRPPQEFNLYHPVPSSGAIKNVHYDICESDGSFTFNFDYCLDSLICEDPTATWEIWLIPSKENASIILDSDEDHYQIFDPFQLYSNTRNWIKTFPLKIKLQYNPNTSNFVYSLPDDFYIYYEDGAILRHSEIARRFIKDRITESNYISDGFKQIAVYRITDLAYNGLYYPNEFLIKSKQACKTNIYHEYGHYVDDQFSLNSMHYNSRPEGFAIFFSFAAKGYASQLYDETINTRDNCEIGPYHYYELDYVNPDIPDDIWPRFGNIDKIRYESTYGADMCRWACYLWNIYDTYDDGIYEHTVYEGKDNDDIQGFSQAIFNYYREIRKDYTKNQYNATDFHNDLKNSSFFNLDVTYRESFNKLFDFLEFGMAWNRPVPNDKNMKSPKLDIMINRNWWTNMIDISWGSSKAYNFGYNIDGVPYVFPDKQFSAIELYNYDNKEISVNIYELSGGVWILNSSINNTLYSTTSIPRNFGLCKVSTYNTYGEDSYIPNIFDSWMMKNSTNEEFEYQSNLFVYPNPFINNTNISLEANKSGTMEIIVFDLLGNIVHNENKYIIQGKNDFNLYFYKNGPSFYAVQFKITYSDGTIENKSINLIKQ